MGAEYPGPDRGPETAWIDRRVSLDGGGQTGGGEGLSDSLAGDGSFAGERTSFNSGHRPARGGTGEAGGTTWLKAARPVYGFRGECGALDAGRRWVRFVVPIRRAADERGNG